MNRQPVVFGLIVNIELEILLGTLSRKPHTTIVASTRTLNYCHGRLIVWAYHVVREVIANREVEVVFKRISSSNVEEWLSIIEMLAFAIALTGLLDRSIRKNSGLPRSCIYIKSIEAGGSLPLGCRNPLPRGADSARYRRAIKATLKIWKRLPSTERRER